ncbi:AAA family ATPase [Sphingobium rhizovicinum]|uniref:AAA family ATPase n=1 Tax=Sphingobium rhizovicinum TaxID=432308 RepID=A0ABV7NG24_9SPHN
MRPTPRKPEKPILWIVAGPNGSGKSTLYNRTDIEGWGGSVWIINPDLLTVSIVEQERLPLDEANLEAVRRIEHWLYASLEVYQTIGVETVLSSKKYQPLVIKAKAAGFQVRMIYVVLKSAELQAERINIRVSEGGHFVPTDKVASRRARSFEQLAWFVMNVDECYIYDNSTGEPTLLAHKMESGIWLWDVLPPDLAAAFKGAAVPIAGFG